DGVGRAKSGLSHDWRRGRSVPGYELFDRPVSGVGDVVESWHVEATVVHETSQHVAAIGGLSKRVHERRDERLAFAGSDDIGKWCERFGIHERNGPANHHDRVVQGAVRGTRWNSRQAQ